MKIGDTKSTAGAARVASAAYARASEPAGGPRPISDTSEVLGIPSHELTPKVRDAIMRLMQEVETLRHELQESHQRIAYLEQLADQDSLAPVANRRAFVRELSRVMAFSERYDAPSSIIYFDVNGLKPINDTYGHPAGDAALMLVADQLVENVRESDIVGRLGGDEFGVILSQADETTAGEKARSLATQIERRPLDWNGTEISIAVSFGTYTFRGGDTAGEALAAADRAMYLDKQARKQAAES